MMVESLRSLVGLILDALKLVGAILAVWKSWSDSKRNKDSRTNKRLKPKQNPGRDDSGDKSNNRAA